MSEVKVGERKGFVIMYDPGGKDFHLQNSDGDEVGSGKTQDDMEKVADKLSKLKFQFPVLAFNVSGGRVEEGKVTSLNVDERTIWFVGPVRGYGSGRSKRRLRHRDVFEKTEHNVALVGEIGMLRAKIKNMEEDISTMIGQFDKPMNSKYFGLTDDYRY